MSTPSRAEQEQAAARLLSSQPRRHRLCNILCAEGRLRGMRGGLLGALLCLRALFASEGRRSGVPGGVVEQLAKQQRWDRTAFNCSDV